tara:strand:- start:1432 stop:2703 length:1272 start_codon:yes stop_codon:yes gene_type:complete
MKTKALLFKTGVAGVVKAAAAFISFIMAMAITRFLGPEQAGLFLLALSILSFFSVFLRLGLDNVIVKLIGGSNGSTYSISALTTGLVWSVLAALSITFLIYVGAQFLSVYVFAKPEFSNVLSIMILALPFMVIFMVLGYAFQAFYRVIAATFFQNFGISFLFLLLLSFVYLFEGKQEFSASYFAVCYLIASIAVCSSALYLWNKQIKGAWRPIKFKDKDLWSSSSNLWVASTMNLTVQWAAILISGALLPASDVAFLSVALRTAMLASFVLTVVNMVVAPRYALLWKENKIEEIQNLAKWSTRGMILLVLPIITVMVFFSDTIMGIFGDKFSDSGDLLAIIALGQFVAVASGSVTYLLNMSGHERDFRKVTLFVGPITILLSYIFISKWGVLGAAIATAVGLSLQNLGALFMVRSRLGFWPIG